MKIDCGQIEQFAGRVSLVEACDKVGNGYFRMATPFTYPNGATVDVFLGQNMPLHNGWALTDMGQTSAFLFDLGLRVTTQKRRQVAADICEALGVKQESGELLVELSEDEIKANLSSEIVRLSQACIRLADLSFTQRFQSISVFKDSVEEFLSIDQVAVERDVVLPGRFNKEVTVDFRTAGQQVQSLIQTLATAGGTATHQMCTEAFRKWYDLRDHQQGHQFITIYDSENSTFREDDLARLEEESTLLAFPAQEEQIYEAVAA